MIINYDHIGSIVPAISAGITTIVIAILTIGSIVILVIILIKRYFYQIKMIQHSVKYQFHRKKSKLTEKKIK